MKIKTALAWPALAALALAGCSTDSPATVVDDATEAAQTATAVDGGQLPSWVDGVLTTAAASLSSIETTVPTADGDSQEVAQPTHPEAPVESPEGVAPPEATPAEEVSQDNPCGAGHIPLYENGELVHCRMAGLKDTDPEEYTRQYNEAMQEAEQYADLEEDHGPNIDEWNEADEEAYWEEYGQMKEEMYGPVDPDNPDAPAQPVDDDLY